MSSDEVIVRVRRVLLRLARELASGQKPSGSWHPESVSGLRAVRQVVRVGTKLEDVFAPVAVAAEPVGPR